MCRSIDSSFEWRNVSIEVNVRPLIHSTGRGCCYEYSKRFEMFKFAHNDTLELIGALASESQSVGIIPCTPLGDPENVRAKNTKVLVKQLEYEGYLSTNATTRSLPDDLEISSESVVEALRSYHEKPKSDSEAAPETIDQHLLVVPGVTRFFAAHLGAEIGVPHVMIASGSNVEVVETGSKKTVGVISEAIEAVDDGVHLGRGFYRALEVLRDGTYEPIEGVETIKGPAA